ncbi:MAG: NAD-dependent epimerase/dehydratase family protein [Acidobacteria bacterium]|nr:MAG: NAD-dependent epimerase/dehydratase family protein [Acidobacteriota bacterium]
MTILVVGATGLLGSSICRRLAERGSAVRALVRSNSPNESRLASVQAEIVTGDLKDGPSLLAACRGCSAVITTANTLISARRGDSFHTVEAGGQAALLRAAEGAGVRRFIYVSLSPGLPSDSPFVRAKREFEARVRRSRLAWTILQPTSFMETAFSPAAGWGPGTGPRGRHQTGNGAGQLHLAGRRGGLRRRGPGISGRRRALPASRRAGGPVSPAGGPHLRGRDRPPAHRALRASLAAPRLDGCPAAVQFALRLPRRPGRGRLTWRRHSDAGNTGVVPGAADLSA